MSTQTMVKPQKIRLKKTADDYISQCLLLAILIFLFFSLIFPLYILLSRSVRDVDGNYIGLSNFLRFLADSSLAVSAWNSLFIASLSTFITIVFGLIFSYALTRSLMPLRAHFRALAMIPLLAPSLLPAIALIFLLGEKGLMREILLGHSVYGPIGIIIGEVVFAFPQAVLILSTALAMADQRLYDAAITLRSPLIKTFITVTLPGIRYALISATLVIFVRVFTDFGVPVVIGGSYPVLATEIYKQVVAQFDFGMGAVVGIFLLIPAVLAFCLQRFMQRYEVTSFSASAVPLDIKTAPLRDGFCLVFCAIIALILLVIIGFAIFGSLVTYWPYNLSLTLGHYDFSRASSAGWGLYINSLILALMTACFGTIIAFVGAWLIERSQGSKWAKMALQLMATLPVAVPGLVLGLAYIFFFNNPANPLHFIYGSMSILVLSSIIHFYTVPHILATATLKQLDPELDIVATSLKIRLFTMLRKVTLPFCLPVIIDIWSYFFVNAMTTVSVIIFLYSADTLLAAIAIVQWNDNGRMAEAAAMSVAIFATSAVIMGIKSLATHHFLKKSQSWRRK